MFQYFFIFDRWNINLTKRTNCHRKILFMIVLSHHSKIYTRKLFMNLVGGLLQKLQHLFRIWDVVFGWPVSHYFAVMVNKVDIMHIAVWAKGTNTSWPGNQNTENFCWKIRKFTKYFITPVKTVNNLMLYFV